METKEIKKIESIKKMAGLYFNTLKPVNDEKDLYTAEIKLLNYYELGCVITSILQLCILALDQEAHKISETNKKQSINVGLILEVVLQLFPIDELELLSEINDMLVVKEE